MDIRLSPPHLFLLQRMAIMHSPVLDHPLIWDAFQCFTSRGEEVLPQLFGNVHQLQVRRWFPSGKKNSLAVRKCSWRSARMYSAVRQCSGACSETVWKCLFVPSLYNNIFWTVWKCSSALRKCCLSRVAWMFLSCAKMFYSCAEVLPRLGEGGMFVSCLKTFLSCVKCYLSCSYFFLSFAGTIPHLWEMLFSRVWMFLSCVWTFFSCVWMFLSCVEMFLSCAEMFLSCAGSFLSCGGDAS